MRVDGFAIPWSAEISDAPEGLTGGMYWSYMGAKLTAIMPIFHTITTHTNSGSLQLRTNSHIEAPEGMHRLSLLVIATRPTSVFGEVVISSANACDDPLHFRKRQEGMTDSTFDQSPRFTSQDLSSSTHEWMSHRLDGVFRNRTWARAAG